MKLLPNKETSTKAFTTGFIAAISSASLALADVGDGYYHHGMSWGGGWFMGPILIILFVVIVIAAIAAGFRIIGNTTAQTPSDRSIEILNERFAAGEIDEAEFQKRKEVLQK